MTALTTEADAVSTNSPTSPQGAAPDLKQHDQSGWEETARLLGGMLTAEPMPPLGDGRIATPTSPQGGAGAADLRALAFPDSAVEAAARAIDEADFGYSIRLTSLVDDESTYTYTPDDGGPALTFPSYEDASEHARGHVLQAKAKAALAAVRSHLAASRPAPDGVELKTSAGDEFRPGDVVADTTVGLKDRKFCVVDSICDDGVLVVAWLDANGRVWSGGLHPSYAELLHRPEALDERENALRAALSASQAARLAAEAERDAALNARMEHYQARLLAEACAAEAERELRRLADLRHEEYRAGQIHVDNTLMDDLEAVLTPTERAPGGSAGTEGA